LCWRTLFNIVNCNNLLIYINSDIFGTSLSHLILLLCFFHCGCCNFVLTFVRVAVFRMTVIFQWEGFFLNFAIISPFYYVLYLLACSCCTGRQKYCWFLLKVWENLIVLTMLIRKMTNKLPHRPPNVRERGSNLKKLGLWCTHSKGKCRSFSSCY